MLVLTRRVGEEIIIAGTIRITLVEMHGDRVRIGITAPSSIRVDRAEVHERRCDSPALVREALRPASAQPALAL